jgi:small subunit ribosomal protein S1
MAVRGRVTSVRDFGAFVDIGGVDGLIPISEIGWSRVENINDFLQVGQEVEVIILSLDWDKERIGLSLKQALADPWSTVLEKYTPRSNHHGTVSRLEKFGAFVTLEPGVDGLLHISKLGGGRKLNHPKEAVVTGQSLEVRIESVDQDKKRISLDLAANQTAEGDEAREEEYSSFTQQKTDKGGGALGTFGDLLQGKLKQKKR